MAMRIAAFAGTNSEFKKYLEEQRAAEQSTAVLRLQQAISDLRAALPKITTITQNGPSGLQIYLSDMGALDQMPGIPEIKELQDKSYFEYRVSKEWLGVEFIAWAKADEVKPVLSGEDILRQMVEEVAGNETD